MVAAQKGRSKSPGIIDAISKFRTEFKDIIDDIQHTPASSQESLGIESSDHNGPRMRANEDFGGHRAVLVNGTCKSEHGFLRHASNFGIFVDLDNTPLCVRVDLVNGELDEESKEFSRYAKKMSCAVCQ